VTILSIRLYGVGGNGFYQPKSKKLKFSEEELKALFENLPSYKEDLENLRNDLMSMSFKRNRKELIMKKSFYFT
jgi:hypothetical protein